MKRQEILFSRLLAVAAIPSRGLDVKVEASLEERARIAGAFELPAIHCLAGSYRLVPSAGGVRLKGEVSARLQRICVVSLEPFESELGEPVDLVFAEGPAQARAAAAHGREITVSLEDEDPPEPILDGKIDLGAVTLEFLALGLEPYPRKPGVELPPENAEDRKQRSPFEALASRRAGSARKT